MSQQIDQPNDDSEVETKWVHNDELYDILEAALKEKYGSDGWDVIGIYDMYGAVAHLVRPIQQKRSV